MLGPVLPVQVHGNNVSAGVEAGEPNHDGNASVDHSSWYSWTAPRDGLVKIDLCAEATFGAVIKVYTGTSVGALAAVTPAFQDGCLGAPLLRLQAAAGTAYRIAIDGSAGGTGFFKLSLSAEDSAGSIASALGPGDGTQAGRLARNGSNGTCAGGNVTSTFETKTHRSKSFTVTPLIDEPPCLTFAIRTPLCSEVQVAAYSGSFNPLEVESNLATTSYLGSTSPFSITAPFAAGSPIVVVATDSNPLETEIACPSFAVDLYSAGPWARARPLVLSGGADATGKSVLAGAVLTARPADWTFPSVTHAYRWQSCDKSGAACADIPGATATTLTPGQSLVGHTLRVVDAARDESGASSSTSAPTGAVKPSNQFKIGKLKLNKHKGTGLLPVTVPGPGTLTLSGKGVVRTIVNVKKAGRRKLKVRPKGDAKSKLAADGSERLKVKVTFFPTGGTGATKGLKLLLKQG